MLPPGLWLSLLTLTVATVVWRRQLAVDPVQSADNDTPLVLAGLGMLDARIRFERIMQLRLADIDGIYAACSALQQRLRKPACRRAVPARQPQADKGLMDSFRDIS